MKKYICLLLIIMVFTTNAEEKSIKETSSLHENEDKSSSTNIISNKKWCSNELDLFYDYNIKSKYPIPDALNYNKPGAGTVCNFYKDQTFKIKLWWYGVSAGFLSQILTGKYLYNSSTKEVVLVFDEEQRIDYKQIGYYTLNGLRQQRLPFSNTNDRKTNPYLIKSCLKVVKEKKRNLILVELYGYEENGTKVSFGQQTFICKPIDDHERK